MLQWGMGAKAKVGLSGGADCTQKVKNDYHRYLVIIDI